MLKKGLGVEKWCKYHARQPQGPPLREPSRQRHVSRFLRFGDISPNPSVVFLQALGAQDGVISTCFYVQVVHLNREEIANAVSDPLFSSFSF